MRTLLTVARELAQCAHDVHRTIPLPAWVDGEREWVDVCVKCGARRVVTDSEAGGWMRPALVDELAQLLERQEDAHA
jgi:hypothetical protein